MGGCAIVLHPRHAPGRSIFFSSITAGSLIPLPHSCAIFRSSICSSSTANFPRPTFCIKHRDLQLLLPTCLLYFQLEPTSTTTILANLSTRTAWLHPVRSFPYCPFFCCTLTCPPSASFPPIVDSDSDSDLYGGAPLCARSIPLEAWDQMDPVLASTPGAFPRFNCRWCPDLRTQSSAPHSSDRYSSAFNPLNPIPGESVRLYSARVLPIAHTYLLRLGLGPSPFSAVIYSYPFMLRCAPQSFPSSHDPCYLHRGLPLGHCGTVFSHCGTVFCHRGIVFILCANLVAICSTPICPYRSS